MVPLLLSCILYGLIARVLYTDYFKKCPELSRHSNQASADTNIKSSRVQVKICTLLFLKLGLILHGRLLSRAEIRVVGPTVEAVIRKVKARALLYSTSN